MSRERDERERTWNAERMRREREEAMFAPEFHRIKQNGVEFELAKAMRSLRLLEQRHER